MLDNQERLVLGELLEIHKGRWIGLQLNASLRGHLPACPREIHLEQGYALQWCRMGVGVPGEGNLSPPGTG